MKKFLGFLLFALVLAPAAQAQVYGDLTLANMNKTLIRMGGVDLTNDDVIDDYLKLSECELYKKNFRDDFAMNKLRTATRKMLQQQSPSFPDAYYFKAKMYLDKYDFTTRVFKLRAESQLRNINSFALISQRDMAICIANNRLAVTPADIGATVDQPVMLEGLPLTEERAKKLIETMNMAQNFNRLVYARFSLMVVFTPQIILENINQRYNMDAQLLNIEFFEDEEFKKPIWVFTRG